MTQAKLNGSMQYVLLAVLVAAVLLNVYALNRPIEVGEVVVPGAAEIAALVNLTIPEVDLSSVDNQLDDIYKKLYASEYDELEEEALDAYDDEYDEDDLEEMLENSVVGFDRVRSVELDDDETEVVVVNLGLDDNEDRLVKVYKEYKVKYELDDDSDKLKDVVYVTAVVTYDDKDGYEAELSYSL
jgi:hypothetical protein